jgi:nucleoid DNA-binding protein
MSDEVESAARAKGLTKRKLLDGIATDSGVQRAKAKVIVDATLRQIGETLARGESLSLPPLGRISVTRSNEKGGAILRFRPAAAGKAGKAGKAGGGAKAAKGANAGKGAKGGKGGKGVAQGGEAE